MIDMFILEPSEPFATTAPGQKYVMERSNAGQLLILQVPKFLEYNPCLKPSGDKGTLIVRPGGIGDLVHMSPAIREVAKRYGKVTMSVADRYADVARYHPDVHAIVPYPIPVEVFDQYSRVFWLEDSVENEKELHMADAFLEHCGIDHTKVNDKRPRIYLPKNVRTWKKGEKKRVGFQVKASARIRTPDVKVLAPVMDWYAQNGWEVYLFGAPGEVAPLKDSPVVNTTQYDPPLSILESASLMRTCDLFIAPDSGLLHIAAALKIPSVGLYGPFPAKLRIEYSPYNVSVEAKAPCAPCFWHSRGTHCPKNCPSKATNNCMVLNAIRPESIIQAGEMAMEKKLKNKNLKK